MGGRPKTPPEKLRKRKVTIQLTEAEYQLVTTAVQVRKLSYSKLARLCVLNTLKEIEARHQAAQNARR